MLSGQDFDIKLEITDGPNYGKIQRLRSNGKWVTTKRFSQRQIEKEKIRYIHSRGNPRVDFITFVASVNGQNVGKSFTFSIKFVRVNLNVISNHGLKLENIGESVITERDLMYQTYPEETDHSKIMYTLTQPPQQGNLFISHSMDKGIRYANVISVQGSIIEVDDHCFLVFPRVARKIFEVFWGVALRNLIIIGYELRNYTMPCKLACCSPQK